MAIIGRVLGVGLFAHRSFEVVFGDDALDALRRRPDKGRRVEIVQLVERQQGRHVGEHLIADPEARLIALLYLVDDVMTHFAVLPVKKSVSISASFPVHREIGSDKTEIRTERRSLNLTQRT